jgi:hypothetical protein
MAEGYFAVVTKIAKRRLDLQNAHQGNVSLKGLSAAYFADHPGLTALGRAVSNFYSKFVDTVRPGDFQPGDWLKKELK